MRAPPANIMATRPVLSSGKTMVNQPKSKPAAKVRLVASRADTTRKPPTAPHTSTLIVRGS